MNFVKHAFGRLEEYLLAVFMAAITIVVFVQVVFRQLGRSLPWSEELTRYLLVWITLIGASQGVKKASHVGVEAFALLLPMKPRKIIHIAVLLICVFFFAIIEVYSLSIIRLQIANHQLSPAMRIPMWTAYAALPAGAALMIVRYLQVLVRSVREFGKDHIAVGLED
ncbi:MAG: TRAP transporter small permease [Synergistaceae bacterium]|jgi:C4-dicarboxylate transporter DctQ subunit|nr:TRAP transporter small permease [Synergistaceae bacterium]